MHVVLAMGDLRELEPTNWADFCVTEMIWQVGSLLLLHLIL